MKLHTRCMQLLLFILIVSFCGTSFAYTINGKALCATTDWVPKGAVVQVFEVDPVPGGAYTINTPALATVPVNDSGNFALNFPWPVAGPGFETGGPDLIFRVTQNIGGANQTIYEEAPAKAHWNLPGAAAVKLEISSAQAACVNPAVTLGTIPNDKLFLFNRIGVYKTAKIDCQGSLAGSSGYCRPRKAPFSFTGMDTDMPFGGTLDMFGWFGQKSKIAYYKVQFSADGGASWTDIDTPLPNMWYDTSNPDPLKWNWVSQPMGPFADGGLSNLYKVPYLVRPDTPWSWLDRVVQFNTNMVKDGKARVRLVPYKWNAAHTALVSATGTDITIDPGFGEIVLQVDNTPPSVQILDIKLNNVSKQPCEILKFGIAATDKISVEFRANDLRGHLRNYVLNALYGHNQAVIPYPATPNKAEDNYGNNAAASPSWTGNLNYTTEYKGNVYNPGAMPNCAYQFRLDASKRTTNGYGLIYHDVEDTWHVTIQRPPY